MFLGNNQNIGVIMEKERINKFIASCSEISRREAEKKILEGKVKLNGKVVTELGISVSAKDKVELNGKVLRKLKSRKVGYLMRLFHIRS